MSQNWSVGSSMTGSQNFICPLSDSAAAGGHLVAAHLVERHVAVGGILPGHAQDPLADDVARHLGAATPEAGRLAPDKADPERLARGAVVPHGGVIAGQFEADIGP